MLGQPEYLPERFTGLTPAQRLVWYFIRDAGESQHSARSIAIKLGIAPHTALTALNVLRDKRLLEVIEPPRGRKGAIYKAK